MEERLIRELRSSLGLSQERFAQLLGVSSQTVRRWESGLTKPLPIISQKLGELQRKRSAVRRRIGGIPMKGPRERGEAGVEFGVGGLFKGISSLLEAVSKMAEEGAEEYVRSGEVQDATGKVRGVYGVSIRMGLGGKPVIEQFGNVRETERGAEVTETQEPLVDVIDEGARLVIVADVPGVEEEDIHINVAEDILEIAASTGTRKYYKEVLLPSSVDASSMDSSYRNGVLEIRLTKIPSRSV